MDRIWTNTTATIGNAVAALSAPEAAYRGPCRVLGAHITRVARGGRESIICEEYCEADGSCQLRKAALRYGALQGLPDILPEGLPAGRTRCIMLTS
jgi:hypothetical protein